MRESAAQIAVHIDRLFHKPPWYHDLVVMEGWVRDVSDMLVQWHECCRRMSIGWKFNRADEPFVVRQIWHERVSVLVLVDPTEHISIVGEGLYPKLRELQRLAAYAFRGAEGDRFFPPLTVRDAGKEIGFRLAGYANILGFASPGAAPRHPEGPVVLLATFPAGFTLVAVHGQRALLVAQGALRDVAGLDLDRLRVWEKLSVQRCEIDRLTAPTRTADSPDLERAFSVDRLIAALNLALRATVLDRVPPGQRGRQDLPEFLDDMVQIAVRGEPDPVGSATEIALRIGTSLKKKPRSSRSTYAILVLLEKIGKTPKRETLVSRPSPHRWHVHCSELVSEEGAMGRSILARWPALEAILSGVSEPVTEEDVHRMSIRGGKGVVSGSGEAPYLFDCAFSQEYELRRERDAELLRVRAQHADELKDLHGKLEAMRRQLDDERAVQAQNAAILVESERRIERLRRQALNAMEAMSTASTAPRAHEENKHIVQSFFEALDHRDWSAAEDLLASRLIYHRQPDAVSQVFERSTFLDLLRVVHEQTPGSREQIDFFVAEDDLVVAHITTRTSGGDTSVEATTIRTYRVLDGRIAEIWGG